MIRDDFDHYLQLVLSGNADPLLQDAASDPALIQFIQPTDLQTSTVTQGGTQYQVQMLTRQGAASVVQRIIDYLKKLGLDLRRFICGNGPEDFNLCAVLQKLGWVQTVKELNAFLNRNLPAWLGLIVGAIATGLLAKLILALSVLNLASSQLIAMCGCDPPVSAPAAT